MSQAGVCERVPGVFNNNYQPSAHLHQSHPNNAPAGAKAHIFQPPRTPSTSSSMHLGRSTASLFSIESDSSTANLSSRKRSRAEFSGESWATPPVVRAHGWSTGLNTSDVMETSLDFESPAPFVTTRYELAGGLNTPSAYAETRREAEEREYFDTGFRRGFGDAGNISHLQAQPSTQSSSSDNWSKTAFNIMGGVVGKVLTFCKSVPFRGFYAGGGKGYDITQPQLLEDNGYWREGETEKITVYSTGRHSTSLPGRFPEDEIIEDYMLQTQERAPTPPRASKRRHIETTDLGNSWIMVAPDTPPQSPSRSSDRYRSTNSETIHNRRSTASTAGRGPHRGHVARRSVHHISRASVSHAGSQALLSTSVASLAPTRSPNSYKSRESPTRASPTKSPVSKEAQKWAAKKRREDREAEESINRLDRQLKTMIREGKEALGTKVEIEEDECLDDFDDPDYFDGRLT